MRSFPKQLAASAVLLGLLAAGAALPATAASPLSAAAAITMPWATVAVESIAPGDYAATMTVGTAQQLSPDILPEKAAKRANVSFVSDNPNIVSVTSDGVAQAVGLGTAHVAATVGDQSCLYTITTEPDASMVVTEMDITLASNTIAVGDTTSLSLAVLPTSAANYADVSLSSSNEGVATVNSFGKITGIAPGTATITATSGSVSASATIKVVASGSVVPQSLSLNTNYVVLKPGSSKTITGSVAPSTASQSLTFKSNDTKIATVNGSGVITGVSTGATSVIVSNGTVSSSVTVIVNRTASASSDGDNSGDGTPADETPTDPVVDYARGLIIIQQLLAYGGLLLCIVYFKIRVRIAFARALYRALAAQFGYYGIRRGLFRIFERLLPKLRRLHAGVQRVLLMVCVKRSLCAVRRRIERA